MPALCLHKRNRLCATIIVSSLLEDEETDMDNDRLQNLIDIYIRNKIEMGRIRSKVAKLRKKKKRLCWSTFQESLTDTQFRRMYRMNRRTFLNLCNVIESNVGVDEFKSERYLDSLENQNSMIGSISRAHVATSSGFVSGEVKVAITLRILAGG